MLPTVAVTTGTSTGGAVASAGVAWAVASGDLQPAGAIAQAENAG